jgi:hypothetical protein
MKATRIVSPFILSVVLAAQSTKPATIPEPGDVMIVGVAHDSSVMGGGISSSQFLPQGKVAVEPFATVTPSGEWRLLSCYETSSGNNSPGCKNFDRDYLRKPHDYSVVSADGFGATVHVNRMSLDDECFGIYGHGTFTGADVSYAAVAAESADFFTTGPKAARITESEAVAVRRALARTVGKKLDSTKELRVYSVTLEGQSLLVIQRAFQQYADKPEYRPPGSPNLDFIFAVGRMENARFHLLFWKEYGDENEQILGLIHLKNGRDFLVSAESDPETSSFRVYGIRDGKFTMIFKGGGGGC